MTVACAELMREEEEKRMAFNLRDRLMFCHEPRQFWVSAPDDERPYLTLMRCKPNASHHQHARHEAAAKTDPQDLLQQSLLKAAPDHEGCNEKRHEDQPVV